MNNRIKSVDNCIDIYLCKIFYLFEMSIWGLLDQNSSCRGDFSALINGMGGRTATGSSGCTVDRIMLGLVTHSVIGGRSKTARDSWQPSPVNSAINCARPSVTWSLDSTIESIPPVMTLLAVHLHSNSKRFITLHNEQAFLDKYLFPILYNMSLFRNTLNRRKGSTILRSSIFSLVNLLRVNELATDTITMSSNPDP